MRTHIRPRILLPLLLLSLAGVTLSGAAEETAPAAAAPSVVTVTVSQVEEAGTDSNDEDLEILSLNAQTSYTEAVAAYEKACGLLAGTDRSDSLNRAIRLVSHSLELSPDNTDAMILAAQCYRARGGKSYAEKYDDMAETALKNTIMDSNFRDLGAMLDYAILCEAEGSADRKQTADSQARYLIQTVEGSPILMKTPAARRMEAMACLILGRQDFTAALLAEADPDLAKLFADTVEQGKWLWLVKTDLINCEFLLYFLRHTPDRYQGVTFPETVTLKTTPAAPAASSVEVK